VAGVPRGPSQAAHLAHLTKVGSAERMWHLTSAYSCSFTPCVIMVLVLRLMLAWLEYAYDCMLHAATSTGHTP
jgi:hypothetical protein